MMNTLNMKTGLAGAAAAGLGGSMTAGLGGQMPALVAPIAGADDDLVARHALEARSVYRKGWLVLGLGVLPAALWMAFAPLSAAVVAGGFVKVDLNRRTVQHAEGGTVRAVHVRDGQKVKAGDPLVELGDVSVRADATRLHYRALAEKAGILRLETEQARGDRLAWSPELLEGARQDIALAEQLRKEEALFAARRESLLGQSRLLATQRQQIEQEMGALQAQINKAGESIKAQQRELDTNRALVKEGYIAQTREMQLEATVADYGVKLEERKGELVRARQRIVDIDLKLRGLANDYAQQASDQLKVAMVRLQEVEQERRKTADASQRQLITAPVDGEVIGLRATNPGTVLAPREPVADIVPSNPKLLVEARIRTEDVSRVHLGQPADVRFTAYKYRTTKLVAGSVAYVSGDRLVEQQTGQAYYTVHVEVDGKGVAEATHGEKLQAGMPAEIYIRGEQHTPLEYLIEPVTQVLRRAGRER
jgi:HlyD family type I secretion membrane fusion protein